MSPEVQTALVAAGTVATPICTLVALIGRGMQHTLKKICAQQERAAERLAATERAGAVHQQRISDHDRRFSELVTALKSLDDEKASNEEVIGQNAELRKLLREQGQSISELKGLLGARPQ